MKDNKLIKTTIKIGDLFKLLNIDNDKYEKVQTTDMNIYIKTPDKQFTKINGYVKKQSNIYKYTFDNNTSLKCSDRHLVLDENYNTCKISECHSIQTIDGIINIINSEDIGFGDVYDIAIDDPHLYVTSNGIIHHNTSITKILSNGYDTLYINGSAERGVDIIRDKIINFCGTLSLEHGKEKLKVVVFEECDGLTEEAWKALRAVIEKYADSVRFIMNCNYIQKVPEPIQSRFNCVHMMPLNKDEEDFLFNEYVKRVLLIINHKSIGINSTEETVKEFIKIDFPDFRSILNKIQSFYIQGKKELTLDSLASSYDYSSLFDIIINKPDAWENYKTIVAEYSNRIDEALVEIGKKFPEYLRTKQSGKIGSLPLILIAIAEHQHQSNFVPDKMIILLSLIYKLQIILNQ